MQSKVREKAMRMIRSGTPWKIEDFVVCTATHPKTPNFSGNSRGRKIHLAKTDTLTVCNMRVDEGMIEEDKNWSMVYNGECKSCFKTLKDLEYKWRLKIPGLLKGEV